MELWSKSESLTLQEWENSWHEIGSGSGVACSYVTFCKIEPLSLAYQTDKIKLQLHGDIQKQTILSSVKFQEV